MIRRSTLVLLTCIATWGASTGAALSTANSQPEPMIIAQASGRSNAGADNGALDINSRGEAVKVLQRRLEAGEYYSGPLDGIYGLATERAVRAFQADAGLEETGSLDEETWRKLQLATGNLVSETVAAADIDSVGTLAQGNESNSPETAPTASELPAEEDVVGDIAASSSEGGLSRVFGLSLGLVAVLASFGIGFFLANKDKADAEEDGEWGQVESSLATSGNAASNGLAPNGSASNGLASGGSASKNTTAQTEPAYAPENTDSMSAANNAYVATARNGHGTAPLAPPVNAPMTTQMNGQMTGQMGSTSPLTQVDIIDGLIGDLRNPDPARRRKAIWELGQRGSSVAMKPLVDAMVDADSKEKSLVLAALSEIGIRSLKPMSKALAIALQDNNPEVRKNAIRDLTRVYDLVVQISQMLGHATEDEDPEVRQTASWALEQLSRIRRSQDIDANVRTFAGGGNSTAPIDMLSSEASIRRSSQQGI